MHRSKNDYEEDIFKDSTMTFGEHLEELRRCLFKAVLGLAAGVIIGLFFGDWVVKAINRPLEKALTAYYQKDSRERLQETAKSADSPLVGAPGQYEGLIDDGLLNQEVFINPKEFVGQFKKVYPQPFKDTEVEPPSEEGGYRKGDLVPILLWHKVENDSRIQAKSLKPHETFMIYLKGSLLVGALLASPWIFYQIWSFIAAGLYPHEKRYVNIYLPFSVVLFFVGAAVAYFFVFGPVLSFLFGFNRWLSIAPDLRISEWLGFVLMLPLGFGICFQLPLVMLFLQRIGIFTVEMYISYWRVAILVIFVLAAIFTPPDPWSMTLLAFPMTMLYFGGILLCRFMPKGRSLLPVE